MKTGTGTTEVFSSSFGQTWQAFLTKLEEVAASQIKLKKQDATLEQLLRETIAALQEDDALTQIELAADRTYKSAPKAAMLLQKEFSYITEKSLGRVVSDAAEGDEALEDAKTGKDSLEDILEDIPGWLKKLLKVLNEILSLISGGGS